MDDVGAGYALDHLTLVDASPIKLAEVAEAAGFGGVCCFLKSLDVLPFMPRFDLVSDRPARRDLRAQLSRSALNLDLAYPFTLSRSTDMTRFDHELDCAADLGAQFVNVLSYDRDATRRSDFFGAFCDAAQGFGLGVVLEFFPRSAVTSLAEALLLTGAIDRPGQVGVNVDLLHLMRSGGSIADVATAPPELVLYAQVCDGFDVCGDADRDHEASSERQLPGDGAFDVGGFVKALPARCRRSLEVPRESALVAGVPAVMRVQSVLDNIRMAMGLRVQNTARFS